MSQAAFETQVIVRADTSNVEGDVKAGVGKAVDDVAAQIKKSNALGKSIGAQVSNLGPLIKDVGLGAAAPGIASTKKGINELAGAIEELQGLRAGASGNVAGQLDTQIAGLSTQLRDATTEFDRLTAAKKESAEASKKLASADTQAATTSTRGNLSTLTSVRQLARSYGVAGIAVTAGIQAARELSSELRVQGAEAGTTTGRLRNLGAELLTGNFIGGIRALGAASSITSSAINELVTGSYRVSKGFDAMAASADAASIGAKEAAKQLAAVATAQAEIRSQTALDFGARKENVIDTATGSRTVARGVSPEDRGGLRGAGAVAAINEDLKATLDTRRAVAKAEREAARETALQGRELRADLTAGLKDNLAVARDQERFYRTRVANARKGSAEEQSALQSLSQAHGRVESIEQSILAAQKKHRDQQVANVQASYQLAQTELQIQEARARTDSQQTAALQSQADLARKVSGDKRLDAQSRAGFELQAAQLDKQVFDINQAAAAEAKRAREEQERQRDQERKDALAKLKAKREEATQLKELRLENAVSAAGLTKSTADDKKAIQKRIAYFKALVEHTKGLEREQARAQLIAERGRLQNLKGNAASGGSSTADFFKQAAQDFNSFGSNIAGRDGVLSGQDARGRFAGLALGAQQSPMAIVAAGIRKLGDAAQPQLTEAQKQTRILSNIQIGIHRLKLPEIAVDKHAIREARAKAHNLGGQ